MLNMLTTIAQVILTHTTPADTSPALPGMPGPYHRVETWAFQMVYPWGIHWDTRESPEFIHHSVIRVTPEDDMEPHKQIMKTLSEAWSSVHGKGPLPSWCYRHLMEHSHPAGPLKVLNDIEDLSRGSRVLREALEKCSWDYDSIGVWHSDKVETETPIAGSRLSLPEGAEIMSVTTDLGSIPE